ncbi:MAG: carboxylating nicotinate-nucleotide diphosphorylase [Alphaproteobacteria bacterium]|nr:carboxylating nicotinate-nucleotide diphosphorylase [Alphaproteobacteria bacterium]
MTPDSTDIQRLIDAALSEDLGGNDGIRSMAGDITSRAVIPEDAELEAVLTTREDVVVAGLDVALDVFRRLDPQAVLEPQASDGDHAAAGTVLARIKGQAQALLTAERTALNFIQHLSGIATLTRAYVERIDGTGCVLLDTRKTIPGLRALAKYATRTGGGSNHRSGLHDGVLIKDNHIAIAGGVAEAVARARNTGLPDVEVECDTLDQVREALEAGADTLLLDNMDVDTLRQAVALRDGANTEAKLEASGGVTLENVRAIAETGVDFISVGRITQSAPAADMGLDFMARDGTKEKDG